MKSKRQQHKSRQERGKKHSKKVAALVEKLNAIAQASSVGIVVGSLTAQLCHYSRVYYCARSVRFIKTIQPVPLIYVQKWIGESPAAIHLTRAEAIVYDLVDHWKPVAPKHPLVLLGECAE